MSLQCRSLVLVLLAASVAAAASPSPGRSEDLEWELGYIQVALADGASVEEINDAYGTSATDSLPPLYQLRTPVGMDEETLIALLSVDPRIAAAEYCYKNQTPEGSRQMVVAAVGGTIDEYLDQGAAERLHLEEAHLVTNGSGQVVAVLDTGVLAGHEALEGAIAPGGYDFVAKDADPTDTANGFDDDGDGLTDEGAGHGTMIAGIVRLVAPGAQILPVRILDDEGRGKTFDVAKGIRHAVQQGAGVINLSLGLPGHSEIIAHEIRAAYDAGVALVAAAGNAGTDSLHFYPASDPRTLSIAALDSADIKTDFSSYDAKVAVSAPGLGIRGPYYDGGWAIGAGTSFAAPFISGQCALVRSLEPALLMAGLYERVSEGVVDIYHLPPNWPYFGELGTGRFDGIAMVEHIPLAVTDPPAALPALRVAPNPAGAGELVRFAWTAAEGTLGTPGAPGTESDHGTLSATLHDAAGREVRRWSASTATRAGVFVWDGKDQLGRSVPAGAYFVRWSAGRAGGSSARVLVVR